MASSASDAIPWEEQSTVLVSSTESYPQYVVVQSPSHPEHGHAVDASAPHITQSSVVDAPASGDP